MRSNKIDNTNKPVAKDERQSQGDWVNQVTLIGRLVAAPELRETASGKHVTTVRIATTGKTHAEFHDVVLWGQLAELRHQLPRQGPPRLRRGSAPEPPVAGHRRQHSTDGRDRRQPAPGALPEERSGGPGAVTDGARP